MRYKYFTASLPQTCLLISGLLEQRINTTAWTTGSTLLSLGLSAPQAIGCMVGVALISALIAVLAGWPGSHLYLGFTVLCRASWGMRGGFLPVLNRIMTACVWMGIQAYWGGQGQSISARDLQQLMISRPLVLYP